MTRSAITDYLQNYPFWLMDIAPIEPLAQPLFTPLLGFSSISAPELTIEITDITEANWFFKRKVVRGGDVSNMTFVRASKWYDSDFYRWALSALMGDTGGHGGSRSMALGGATPRRDLLLIHFLSRSPLPPIGTNVAAISGTLAIQGTATGLVGGVSSLASRGYLEHATAITGAGAAAATGAHMGPFEFIPRLPAKAWVLYGCIPTRYKTGGDFDATDASISLQELEVALEGWDELTLGSDAAPQALGFAIADAARTGTTR